MPGKNYAVFTSANQISYESKQLDTNDFVVTSSMPTQFILLSELSYCKFRVDISKCVREMNKQNYYLFTALN
jgi:hypothetical protein